MTVVYTEHTEDKLREKEAKKFSINKARLKAIVKNPKIVQELPLVKRAIGPLDKKHSLCVIYKFEADTVKIITFFPAEKGRYES